ncbi:response regulator [Streptomyces rapamycinicus]|uniref:DNA-binding NarL/FixJ family response regulator n=1 Tax=Streptomyces rapamycinicus TaxID=1226757 RepID=A0ABR6LSM2_9ACTN|nr:response regulator transcription factor [Streptomyces rapamycinicus]MBB4784742.1 DNA-binding NarL/FixJ family response regulator [Streptomyces rapamycinicus]UTO65003.1 response regulator transcription factor [Streptomyces rapamycinicus]UTP32959.1 response regulator transcription factor [Streptomyces rapamycinicus NRRL 5491]
MIRVAVVDDEALVRSGLRLILGTAPDIEVVAECSGAFAVDTVLSSKADVVLLDIRMPDADGLSVLRQLRAAPASPAVAMLTTFDVQEYLAAALRAGAAGFLLKDTDPEQLVRAVRTLAEGGSVLDPAVTRAVIGGYLAAEAEATAAEAVEALTPREREVLTLLGEGLANPQIAERMGLAPSTVKDHVRAVLGKLGGLNRVQAAIVADRAGLVTSRPPIGGTR